MSEQLKHTFSRKDGRKQLRTIKTVNKKRRMTQLQNEDHKPQELPELKDKNQNSIEVVSPVTNITDNNEKRKDEVYTALLTLLESDHPINKSKKHKASNSKNKSISNTKEINDVDECLNDVNDEQIEEIDDVEDSSINDSEDELDPFVNHFNTVDESEVNKFDQGFKNKQIKYASVKIPLGDVEDFIYSKPILHGEDIHIPLPQNKETIYSYFIKKKLKMTNDWENFKTKTLTSSQKKLVDPIFQYKDMLYEYDSYTEENEYRDLYTLHILNHVYKTRDQILKNNRKLQDNPDQELLDQGFTRPKVLIVVPTRNTAYEIMLKIIEKSGLEQIDKKSKFEDQFHEDSIPFSKPKSFQHIFKGNTNDFFVFGVKFTRKTLKIYSNFYQSDIIFSSPLGMHLILENTDKKKRQDDFLSSIELMIVDQLHSIEFQNISHLLSIFHHINKIPQQQHNADFSRIRIWSINDQSKFLRQTLIFTKYLTPFANSLINGKCLNLEGRYKNKRIIGIENSAITQIGLKIRQIFQRLDLPNLSSVDEPDFRFRFFINTIIPTIVKSIGYDDGILIYIPEYTDYIRVRNYLSEKTTILFGDINEYSNQKQLTSNRSLFQHLKYKVLLYTERLHHFRRYEIKGVKSIIFYKPPTNPEFYYEVVRFIGNTVFLGNADMNISTVKCVYSKLDSLSLERLVGTQRAAVLTHGQSDTYEFK